MTAAPQSTDGRPCDSNDKASAIAKAKESTENCQPSSSDVKPSTFGRRVLALVQTLAFLAAGAVLGGYLTAHLLESEYQNIVADLQSDQRKSLLRAQNDHAQCSSRLALEERTKGEEVAKLRMHADRNERAFREIAERHVNETNAAYAAANEGLGRASDRLKVEVEKRESARLMLEAAEERLRETEKEREDARRRSELAISQLEEEREFRAAAESRAEEATARLEAEEEGHETTRRLLGQAEAGWKAESEDHASSREQLDRVKVLWEEEKDRHEATQLESSQEGRRLQAIRNTLTQSAKASEVARVRQNATEEELLRTLRELEVVEEELDRRDVERAECYEKERELTRCRESLEKALENPDRDCDTTPAASEKEQEIVRQLTGQIALALEEKKEAGETMQVLKKEGEVMGARVAEVEIRSQEIERQKNVWVSLGKSMMAKISFRSRMKVLDQYGPGPHFVKLSLAFQSDPADESVLIKLAPLDLMPHTIHTFLTVVDEKSIVGGTFILARDHIIVGGPVDTRDQENNRMLEQRMMKNNYFPDGALLFREHSEEYPHVTNTVGFGEVGGPVFYFNVRDNTEMHGPLRGENGGISKEGDPCFGEIVEGLHVVQRIMQLRNMENDSLESPVIIRDTQVVNITA